MRCTWILNASSDFEANQERQNAKSNNGKSSQFLSTASQTHAVMVKNLVLFAQGMLSSYPTILIPRLLIDDLGTNITLTAEDESWIGSIGFMCVPVGSVLSGVFIKLFGRRRTMQLACVPFFFGSLAFGLFMTSTWQMYLALAFTGFASGLTEAPVITYVAEITEPHLRGVLSGTSFFANRVGNLLEFVIGSFYDWRTVALINCSFPLLAFILIFFIPESPQWLIMKNRIKDAQKSLAWLRGWTSEDSVKTEFDTLIAEERQRMQNAESQSCVIGDYFKWSFLNPMALLCTLFAIQSISGYVTIQMYAVQVFAALQSPLDSYHATIIFGCVLLLGSIVCTMLINRVGKRKILLTAFVVGGCGLIVAATYVFIQDIHYRDDTNTTNSSGANLSYNWIPLVAVCVMAFALQCAFMIPWTQAGEIFPFNTSHTGTGLVSAICYIFSSLACKFFGETVSALTFAGVLWLYGGVCIFGTILMYFWLPETEGKTLQEIADHYAGISKLDNKVRKKKKAVV